MSKDIFTKYQFVLNNSCDTILASVEENSNDSIKKEFSKIKAKLKQTKLQPNERKKVNSKKHGKWLCFCGQDNRIYGALTEAEAMEVLIYKCLLETSEMLEDVSNNDSSKIKELFQKGYEQGKKGYMNDSLRQTRMKVDIAKEKMMENINAAMQNNASLTRIDEKASDLKDIAKDFAEDADKLETYMTARNARLRLMLYSVGVGGGGAVILPLIIACI